MVATSIGANLRAMLRLSLHEVRRATGAFRGKGLLAIVGVAVLALALFPIVSERGLQPDRGLYTARVDAASPFAEAVMQDPRFDVVLDHEAGASPDGRANQDARATGDDDGDAAFDLVLGPEGVRAARTDAGRAALRQLEETYRQWQERELESEPDSAAAFPLQVNLLLVAPDPAFAPRGAGQGNATPSILDESAPQAATAQVDIRPSEVEPPFPVRSLLLTFAFLIPMNFVAQMHSGALLADRVRHRALLSLTLPFPPRTIIAGRSLPYVLAGGLVVVAAGLATGAGWQGWLAILPAVLFILASSLLLGLLARSERELTFLLTGTTTMLAVFLFLPAVFTAIPAVAFLSPVSVVVASIEGETVGWRPFLYSTLPLLLCTAAVGMVASALYREETLFSHRRPRDRILAALAVRASTAPRTILAGVLSVPFAFVLELLVLSLAIPLGLAAALPVTLVGVVLVEERLKLAVAAAFRRRTGRPGWLGGALAGAGFFVGEKLALVLTLVGFGDLILGEGALRVFGVTGGWWLVFLPLPLHMAASALAASGLGRARPWPTVLYLAACVLHLAYNLTVVWLGGAA